MLLSPTVFAPNSAWGMDNFPRLSGSIKIKKFGKEGLTALAEKDKGKEKVRK